jgi:hypothetical protein
MFQSSEVQDELLAVVLEVIAQDGDEDPGI